MKSSLVVTIVMVLLGMLLMPLAVFAQTGQAAAGNAPISQPLVREGALAVKLVNALRLGTTADEAEAEGMLVAAGIAPRNGWISDYPVTPDIVVELRNAVRDAADGNQLTIGKDEALKTFDNVMVSYGLNVSPSAPQEVVGNAPSSSPDTTVINNYYYDEGPPVVTYYAPPPDYYYLYSWVPYPFWGWNYWFPGFYVLADFTFVIDGHGHHHHDGFHGHHDGFRDHHDGFRGHREFVSNHFRDPGTGRMSRIDPAHRGSGGTFTEREGKTWSSPSATRSAQAIFNRSSNAAMPGRNGIVRPSAKGQASGQSLQNRTSSSPYGSRSTISGTPAGRTSGSPSVTRGTSVPYSWDRMFSAPSVERRTFGSARESSRTFGSPPAVNRSFSSPSGGGRVFNSPSVGSSSFVQPSGGRVFSAPSSGGSRMFSAPAVRGGTSGFSAGGGRGSSGGWQRR